MKPYVNISLLKKVRKDPSTMHKTWSRSSTIIPEMIDMIVGVYNGHRFIPVHVNEDMVGKKFGEFAPTRTRRVIDKKKRNK
jgi:small subunit ribosomal protein S19